jgi:hypothetical protein
MPARRQGGEGVSFSLLPAQSTNNYFPAFPRKKPGTVAELSKKKVC